MKFIHIADVHLGMKPDRNKPWGKERTQAIRDSFAKVIEQANVLDVDCLFISGDLFHHQPLFQDLKEVDALFSTIPQVQVVLIAGSHDWIRPNSALLSFTWSSNVTFLMSEQISSVFFDRLNLEVHGFSYHAEEITAPVLRDLQVPKDSRIHVLLAYGSDTTHLPLETSRLAHAGFSYMALGQLHKPELAADFSYAYPGSLEPLSQTETGRHGMIVGEIDPRTGQTSSLEFVPLAHTQYIPLVVHVTPATTNKELIERITDAIETRGVQNIYRFRICGLRNSDNHFDLTPLTNHFRIVEVVDESEPQYDFYQLFTEHPSDMIGFYIQAFPKEAPTPVEKKALCYGMEALLHTIDERSDS